MFASNIIVRQGFTQTSWSHFTRMVKKRGSDRKALKIILRKEQFDAGGRKYHQSFTLYSLLQEFQNFESSILHDKVFAQWSCHLGNPYQGRLQVIQDGPGHRSTGLNCRTEAKFNRSQTSERKGTSGKVCSRGA